MKIDKNKPHCKYSHLPWRSKIRYIMDKVKLINLVKKFGLV